MTETQDHDCDQIGNDLFIADREVCEKHRVTSRANLETAKALVKILNDLNKKRRTADEAIELVLDGYESQTGCVLEFYEEKLYRIFLRKVIGRRRKAAREERISRDVATNFPVGQEY